MRPLSFPNSPTWYDEEKVAASRRKYDYQDEITYNTIEWLGERQKDILDIKLESRTGQGGDAELSGSSAAEDEADAILSQTPAPAVDAIEAGNPHDQNFYVDYATDRKADEIERALALAYNDELASLRAIFTPDYGTARRELISLIGQYCSYCESPVGSRLAIEHRLPKHYFPHLGFRWSNFLLACDSCNSIKGATPRSPASRAMAEGSGASSPSRPAFSTPVGATDLAAMLLSS